MGVTQAIVAIWKQSCKIRQEEAVAVGIGYGERHRTGYEWRYEFMIKIIGEVGREEARRTVELGIEHGDIYLLEDEKPVSMTMKTRQTLHRINGGLAYTPPDKRGWEYATACDGELSRLLLLLR